MVRINLLPTEIQQAREHMRRQRWLILAGAAVAVIMLALYGFLLNQTAAVRTQVEDVEVEETQVQAAVASYAPHVELQGAVSRRSSQIAAALGSSPDWTQLFLNISGDIPGGVWLTDLGLTAGRGEEETGELVMQGYTYDHPATARWLEDMEEISHLTDVRCSYSAADEFRGYNVVRFEVKAGLPGEARDLLKAGGE